ncbi:corepressor of Pangolin [Haematobia irritans]|uniref:corepressor of Pangolin n=1 Tax=Haematobia irritans TaxID=7368 RepID=UPI003F504F63
MQHHHQTSSAAATNLNFTNTAKLPIETVKRLILSVSRRPHLWIRTNNGQKRSDIHLLWQQVSQECHLPADICRIKWGHLRDNFRKVFIRNTLSAEPPTTWRFYNDMRFMEPAVAENVMRHHRLREQSFYWQELHNAGHRDRPTSSSNNIPEAQYDQRLQNQFHFSEFAGMFQHNASPNKRIKLEASESETSIQGSFPKDEKTEMNFNHINGQQGDDYEEDDDDEFDEDAVSTEDNFQNINIKDNKDKSSSLMEANNSDDNKFNKINVVNFKMHQEMATNTEPSLLDPLEEDSDRMFLLSLLPYLRKVQEQRKLQVRQKLQDVLIEEFG